jgi:hypothetical protein
MTLSANFETISHISGLLDLSLSQVAQKTTITFQLFFKSFNVVITFSKASAV